MSERLYFKEESPKNKYFRGLIAGVGVGLIVGGILAGISIMIKTEIMYLIIVGLALVGFIVSRFLPNKSAMGIVIGALACGVTFLFYALILLLFGYWYEDGDSSFWFMLILGIIYGGYMGFRGKKGFEEDNE